MTPSPDVVTPSPMPVVPYSGAATEVDVLNFIASFVASVAWPVVVLILVLVFKEQITKLVNAIKDRMPDVERVKTPWGEMVWSSSAVNLVSTEVDASLPGREGSGARGHGESRSSVARELARIEPSAGVIHAFLGVEQQVGLYLRAVDVPWRFTPIQAFRRAPAAPLHLQRLVDELAKLRNAAAHGAGDVSLDSALEYIDSAQRVAEELKTLTDDILAGNVPL
jgi:hypothetical protein